MPRFLTLLTAIALGAVIVGCTPQIGDPCSVSIDCPELTTCDTEAQGGYCLRFDCENQSCPDGSLCVFFDTFTACMKYCVGDSDCRTGEGQVCRTDIEPFRFCYHPETIP